MNAARLTHRQTPCIPCRYGIRSTLNFPVLYISYAAPFSYPIYPGIRKLPFPCLFTSLVIVLNYVGIMPVIVCHHHCVTFPSPDCSSACVFSCRPVPDCPQAARDTRSIMDKNTAVTFSMPASYSASPMLPSHSDTLLSALSAAESLT